jgi:hypothetical protein
MICLLTDSIFASADPETGTADCARIFLSFSLLSPAFMHLPFLLDAFHFQFVLYTILQYFDLPFSISPDHKLSEAAGCFSGKQELSVCYKSNEVTY